MKAVIFITGIYFLIGALLVFYLWYKGRNGWLKYFTYLVIVTAMELLYYYGYSYWINAVIVLLAYYEIVNLFLRKQGDARYTAIMLLLLTIQGCTLLLLSNESWYMLQVYCVVFAFDGFSQLGGQLLGRHRLAQKVSPNKTTEGLVIGLLAAILTACLIHIHLSIWMSSLVGLVLGLFALAGDLLASWYKRMAGVKDYNELIPGHGGILDRFDSLLGASTAAILLSLGR